MGVLAGKDCTIKTGLTPVAVTDEAMTDLGAQTIYVVTDSTKRAIDPATAITVKDNGGAVTSTDYAVDYASGKVTFSTPRTVGHTITFSGKYVPLSAALLAKTADVQIPAPVMADATCLGDTGGRQVEVHKRCSVTLTHIHDPDEDLDTGGGTMKVSTVLGAEKVFLEVDLGPDEVIRGWFAPGESKVTSKWGGIVETSTPFTGVVQTCVGRPTTDQALFSHEF